MLQPYNYNLALKFQSVVQEHGARTALRFPSGEEVSYAQLEEISNRAARALLSRGLGRGDVVALFNSKSLNAFACMLGCLKVGATYTNLDVTSPWERLRKIVETCRPALLLDDYSEGDAAARIAESGIPVVSISGAEFAEELNGFSAEALPDLGEIHGGQAAYIMFTSGSTGFPKGAVMSHGNVLNLVEWSRTTFSVDPDDVFTNINPIYFDNSVFDFYSALFTGATLCPVPREIVSDASALVDCISRMKCTIWFSVPSLLVYLLTTRALEKEDLPTIRHFVFGGEGFPKPKLKELFELYGDRARLVNVYGPTECTCICSAYIVGPSDFEDLDNLAPLGLIAPNFGYEILAQDERKPDFGELCLTGPNVGLGYFNDAERTASAFVDNPNVSGYRETMYRTGDLVMRANGQLHFRGRVDNQIKHLGYRIELEEIEAAFNSLEYTREAGVVYQSLGDGMGQIVAFVSVTDERDEKMVQEDVKKIVPPYMVPRRVRILPILPKNQNGKIDRVELKELLKEL